jgi:dynein heavy chain
LVNNVISNLREVQQNWGYLENLFIHSEEVRKELPKESDEFVQIDADVKILLKDAKKREYAINFSTQEGYLKKIENANEKLVKCEKALQRFMEDKRTCFPRFYFVSPADLLDILSNGNVPEKVMPHLPKIFQAINDLKLDMNTGVRPAALGMISCVGIEYVQYSEPLKLLGKVENYMQDVIDSMRTTLRLIGGASWKKSLVNPRTEWLKMDCSQCTLLVALASWVDDVEKGMAGNSMPNALKSCIE